MTNPRHQFVCYLAITFCLWACGGGGGGSSSPPSPPAPAANQAPNASFSINATSGTAPLVVTVDASASSDTDGQIASYSWDFNGEPAIGPIAQFTFSEPGEFDINLTVSDNDGDTSSVARTVNVTAAAVTSTLSGVVRILSSTAVDSDVNDRLTLVTSNNTFDDAQPLPAPVTLGGYANIAGQGERTGRLFNSGDPADFYRVSLNGDEIIALTIAESTADLDLRLWDEQKNIIDASAGISSTETIEVPQPGTYYIEVFPFSGASNYVLFVGQDGSSTSTARTPSRLTDPFVAGELIIKHRRPPSADTPNMRTLSREVAEEPLAFAATGTHTNKSAPGLYQLLLANGAASPQSTPSPTANLNLPVGANITAEQRMRLQTLATVKTLAQDANVDYAELNIMSQPHAEPNDSFFRSQWHYPAINLPTAWETTTGSPDVIVAVIDTGVLVNHPDLNEKLVAGYDFISDAARALDGNGLDADPNDPGDLGFGGSSSFHGSHVAGTVGAETNNNSGVAGVAWQTSIMPLRALGRDGGTTFDVIQAVRFAAGLSNNSGTLPPQRADIINLSLGSSFSSQAEQDVYNQAIAAGVIVVASAGNESSSLPSYPAAYDGVIGVSATTITNDIASYSNFGSFIDVAAPGGSNVTDLNGDGIGDGVISTIGDDSGSGAVEFGFGTLNGTSMAAPHVAGVIALMKAVYPELTPTEFNNALVAGNLTDDLGAAGRDERYGYGLINAQKAVIAAGALANGQSSDPGPIVTASASTLNFGRFLNSLNLNLQNVGTGNVDVLSASANEPWISLTAPATGVSLGAYTINIDRTGLSDGSYQARITFDTDANDVEVVVIMQVSSLNLTADAGLFYIILVDDNGSTAFPAFTVLADRGEYPFTLRNITAGEYRLFAGTDADDDGILCDAGEACGAFTTLDAPDVIAVNGDITGLDFEAGFRVNLTTNLRTRSDQNGSAGFAFEKPESSSKSVQKDETSD